MKKRIFLAIDFPDSFKRQIGQVTKELKSHYPEIRWEKKENLHLTLKFLGWTDQIGKVAVGMEKAAGGVKPFWFQPTVIGSFLRESLIVWLGTEVQEGLLKLVENLESEMEKIGFPKERRDFAAHITLGRLRHAHPAGKWRQIGQEVQSLSVPQFEKLTRSRIATPAFSGIRVEQIVLMESQLTPQGSIYTTLKTQSLSR